MTPDKTERFETYWKHRATKEKAAKLARPVLRSYQTEGLDGTEEVFWATFSGCRSILDIGAGDNRLKRKFEARGYVGSYVTCDLSREFQHDFYSLSDVTGSYEGIFLLEVIEHLSLDEFYSMIQRLVDCHLRDTGTIIVSTPNPASVTSMWSGDMTHVQHYPLNDLLAFFMVREFTCKAFRVLYSTARPTVLDRIRLALKKVFTTQILGADYADGLIVIATRSKPA